MSARVGNFKAIVFDLDGTLVDSAADIAGSLVQVASGHSVFPAGWLAAVRKAECESLYALLSPAYSIPERTFTAVVAQSGRDGGLCFSHERRPGRPAVSVGLMEPLRRLLAVLEAIAAVGTGVVVAGE